MDFRKIINVAVIAHVDAGKSTLVDAFLAQSHVFSDHEEVVAQVMDSNDLERERGITIYSKNCSIVYQDYKINIVDTPGHADFSSEVERIIKTVDTVILLVDSSEGPMPQTRFVLKKSLEAGLRPILLINKIDKKDARINEVIDEVYDLFLDLNANDDQLDFPILYGIARSGIVRYNPGDSNDDINPLFETIVSHVDPYPNRMNEPLQMQVSALAYDDYIGRIGVGRVYSGVIKQNSMISVCNNNGKKENRKIANLYNYQGLKRTAIAEAQCGDIVMVSGIENIEIGDTIGPEGVFNPLPQIDIEEPTLSMNFMVNTSPFQGRSGKYVTSRNIKERLEKELEVNVGLRVESTATTDTFKVSGRGELHLSILLENMRREGYEVAVSRPEVIFKKVDGKLQEPVEEVICSVPNEYSGTVINKLNLRKGQMIDIQDEGSYTRVIYHVPTRGLLGYRSEFINDTKGEGVMVRKFIQYEPFVGEIAQRSNGALISMASGKAMTYALWNLQERGQLFITPQTEVYEGMIIGVSSKTQDIEVNPTVNKKMTAIRSTGNDEAMKLVPARVFSLEEALEFINDDELVEITPDAIRLRKRYLTNLDRRRHMREVTKEANKQ
ncbi:MAG: translational GTPase TypA [Erysipelotrichaceae bacterium]|nr:translational GTPase TypA [Erysipelotrichaceae bacterium]MBQ1624626.1 translational GTPase TypA [Erysipelotrichaceae bacterium]MBQ4019114.1 translational GTPase TypA [Erysipelotrichaceae bacterium]MBQ5553299.1 translational GTPase TypA [Erysipelotrichaceae bacterium]MBQ5554161.1 translational GTPase TypA [Erysipelotrichaceae bacterium]